MSALLPQNNLPPSPNPTTEFDQERLKICRERRRQAHISFNLALVSTAASAILAITGTGLLLMGKVPEGTLSTTTGIGASLICSRLAKDANDRLDKLNAELTDDIP